MAFTYTGDPGNNKIDYIRFIVGDTTETMPILQDAEIQYIIDNYPKQNQQLAMAFRQCASYFGARMVKRSLGPQSEDATKRLEYYMSMADKYERDLTFAGPPPLPNYQGEKVFEKNMMGNSV